MPVQIVIVDVGRKDSPYEEFILKLPPNDCRFAGATIQAVLTSTSLCIRALPTRRRSVQLVSS